MEQALSIITSTSNSNFSSLTFEYDVLFSEIDRCVFIKTLIMEQDDLKNYF